MKLPDLLQLQMYKLNAYFYQYFKALMVEFWQHRQSIHFILSHLLFWYSAQKLCDFYDYFLLYQYIEEN